MEDLAKILKSSPRDLLRNTRLIVDDDPGARERRPRLPSVRLWQSISFGSFSPAGCGLRPNMGARGAYLDGGRVPRDNNDGYELSHCNHRWIAAPVTYAHTCGTVIHSLGRGSSSGTLRDTAQDCPVWGIRGRPCKRRAAQGWIALRVQEQPFQVLAALLEQPGEVISREALIARLWPDGTVVDFDRGLNAAVTRLRQTLSDSPETPRYIETVSRRGYRFIGPLGAVGGPAPTASPAEPASTTPKRPVWVWPALALLLIGSVVISLWVFRPREVAGRPLSAIPVTSEPGDELCPSFSPDGTRIAYEWDEGHGDSHIFIKLVGAGDPLRLTSVAAHEFGPAWSPDGSQIAFLRRLDEGTLGVILKPAISGVERPLTKFAAPVDWWPHERGHRWLAWTHDGKHLIVSGAEDASAPLALYVVSVESAEKRRLTTPPNVQTWDRSPAVSPDGRTVVFSRGVSFGDSTLYRLTLSDDLRPIEDVRRVTTDNDRVLSLAWTPDGREIVFSDNRGLWRIQLDANGASRQPVWVGEGEFPAITKGRLIYARSFEDSNIWRQELPRDGGTVPPASPLILSTAADMNPQYSPDGTRIAFQSRRSGYAEIWLCASDGTQCGQMTFFHGSPAGTPRWSRDQSGSHSIARQPATGMFT